MYSFIFGCAGSSLLRAGGFLWFRRRGAPLYLQSTGFSSCLLWNTALGTWALVIVAQGLSCSKTGGIFLDHPWTRNQTPCPLHWQAESQPVDHQGSPDCFFMVRTNWNIFLPGCYLGDSLHPSLDRSVRDLNSVCFIFGKVKVVSVRSIHYKDAFFFFQFSFFLKKKNWNILALYAALVSAVQWSGSAVSVQISPPSWSPPPHPSRSSRRGFLCFIARITLNRFLTPQGSAKSFKETQGI